MTRRDYERTSIERPSPSPSPRPRPRAREPRPWLAALAVGAIGLFATTGLAQAQTRVMAVGPRSEARVSGAPYSAEAVTEITQTLPDGNRIARTVTASVHRDSEGRTRRDETLAALGTWMPDKQPKEVFIQDPVAGVSYILNEEARTAVKLPLLPDHGFGTPAGVVMHTSGPDEAGGAAFSVAIESGEPPVLARGSLREAGVKQTQEGKAGAGANGDGPAVERTPLGKQVIEGVEATGTQTVTTIPAGAIGNDQPIRITSEEWYAEALQTIVMSKRSDPRTGDMVYRLTNLDRAEPAAALFQVPADYTIKEPTVTKASSSQRKSQPR